ncbi:hypothetical protein ACFFHP_17530, partial [Glutamicibacter ardleyensis]
NHRYGAVTNFGRILLGRGFYLSLERQRHQIRDGSIIKRIISALAAGALILGSVSLASPATAAEAKLPNTSRTGFEQPWPSLKTTPATDAYMAARHKNDGDPSSGATQKAHDRATFDLMHAHTLAPTTYAYICGLRYDFEWIDPQIAANPLKECKSRQYFDADDAESKAALAWDANAATHTDTHDVPGKSVFVSAFRAPVVNEDMLLTHASYSLPWMESGLNYAGTKWTSTPGDWTQGTKLTYQWFVDGKPIPGATKQDYTPLEAHNGHKIHLAVTGKKDGWYSHTEATEAFEVILGSVVAYNFEYGWIHLGVGSPVKVTPTYTAAGGPQDGKLNPAGSNVTYTWYVNGIVVPGATSNTYTPRAQDVNKKLRVAVRSGAVPFYTTFNQFIDIGTIQKGLLPAHHLGDSEGWLNADSQAWSVVERNHTLLPVASRQQIHQGCYRPHVHARRR